MKFLLLLPLIVSMPVGTGSQYHPTFAPPGAVPTVGVWSVDCNSFNISTANCGSNINLAVGNSIFVEINVTNAPRFNGFETALYFDPTYINATQVQLKNTGTTADVNSTLLFQNVIAPRNSIITGLSGGAPFGAVLLSVADLGHTYTIPAGTYGTLAIIKFKIMKIGVSPLTLAAGIGQPSTFAKNSGSTGTPDWTRLTAVVGSGNNLSISPLGVSTSDGYFKNNMNHQCTISGKPVPCGGGPVAIFTFSPQNPKAGQQVTFDPSLSYDSDNATLGSLVIITYIWDFGDGFSSTSSNPTHIYAPVAGAPYSGNFSIRLTILDQDESFQAISTQKISVIPPPVHDVGIYGLTANPQSVTPGTPVVIAVTVRDLGTYTETYNLTLTYGAPPKSVLIEPGKQIAPSKTISYNYTIDTTGYATGVYSVTATVRIPVSNSTTDQTSGIIFSVFEPSTSPFFYVVGGIVALAVGGVVGALFLRRRGIAAQRRREDAA